MTRDEFLLASLSRSTGALVASGTRVLDFEFGESTRARTVRSAIFDKGERTVTGIHQSMGVATIAQSALSASLASLAMKRVVVADEPLWTRAAAKDRRWRIADPALRFWLAFVEPALGEIDRGDPDLAMTRVKNGYTSRRGRAIEPVVRSAWERLLTDTNWPHVARVGGWWPRSNSPEIGSIGGPGASFGGVIRRHNQVAGEGDREMTAAERYASPGDFRRALTDKLTKQAGRSQWSLQQLQRQIAYDRLLERLFVVGDGWIVKGPRHCSHASWG